MKSIQCLVLTAIAALSIAALLQPESHGWCHSRRPAAAVERLPGYEQVAVSEGESGIPVLSRIRVSTVLLDGDSQDPNRRRSKKRHLIIRILLMALTVLVLTLLLAILSKAITLCMMESIISRYERDRRGDGCSAASGSPATGGDDPEAPSPKPPAPAEKEGPAASEDGKPEKDPSKRR